MALVVYSNVDLDIRVKRNRTLNMGLDVDLHVGLM